MSFWITKKEPGKRKNIINIILALEFIPLLIIILAAIVVTFFKN